MDRREFLATTAVAAVSPLPHLNALSQSAVRQYIELRRYHLLPGTKQRAFTAFVGDVAIPAMNRAGVGRVGAFTVVYGENAPTLLLVSHAAEMSHVFGNPWLPTPDPGSKAVGDAMNAYWSTFAATGDPNDASAPATWPAFAPDANDDDERLQLDPNWEVLQSFRKAECALWRKTYDAAFAN